MNIFEKVLKVSLGTSWKTTLAGYGTAATLGAYQYVQTSGDLSRINVNALIVAVGAALLGRFAKDHNVSNAPAPGHAEIVKT